MCFNKIMNKKIKINNKYFLKTQYKKNELLKFIRRISENDFLKNRDITLTPWKYLNKKNFEFFFLTNLKSKIIGVIVIINTKYSCHLSFLYIDRNFRGLGFGKILIKFFTVITRKNLLTVHVFKNDLRVLKFYKANKFLKATKKSFLKNSALNNWRKRVYKFDKSSLRKRYILYFTKNISAT